jgi:hypothetical protein
VGGLQELGEEIETGSLAGAVRADQSMDAAARDPQVDPADGHEAGKFHPEIVGFENDIVTHDAIVPFE